MLKATIRLYKTMIDLKLAGWHNITAFPLELRYDRINITQLIPLKTRSQTNGPNIFLHLLSPVVDHVLEHTNNTHQSKQKPLGRKLQSYTEDDVLSYIIMILEVCCHRQENFTEHLMSKDREGLSKKRYDKFHADLTFNIGEVYELFNSRLKETLKVIFWERRSIVNVY